MKLNLDKTAHSLSYYSSENVINLKKINKFLKKKTKNFNLSARVSINKTSKDDLNYMIISQHPKVFPIIKYYKKKNKVFYCHKGLLFFFFFTKTYRIKKHLILKKDDFLFLKKGTIYINFALKKGTVHSEILTGPFNRKTKDRVEYLAKGKLRKEILKRIKDYKK